MPLFRWITRLMSVSVQETPRLDPHVQLSITRLEERRVLNADASLVGSQMPLADCSPVTEELELPTSLCNSGGGPITASVASTIDHDTPQWLFELAIANAAQNQEVVVTTVEDSAELNAFLTMVQALPAQDAPVTIVAGLAEGTYSGLNLSLPSNVTLVLDGQGGGVTIVGGSPALEVTSGQVIVQDGVTFSVSSDDPTIVVQAGGWLTLTDTIVHESDGFDQSAILVHAGGELDLSSGDNTLNVRGAGQLMTWQDSASLDIVGNTLQLNGNLLDTSERADNFEIEDRITHALDNGTFGRVTWVPDSVYVTTSTLGIQRGIDVADAGDTVHIAAGTYVHTGQIDVDKSVTIIGAGQDETIIRRSGQATGTELRTVQVNAPDVTFQSLQFAGWTDVPSNANVGNGYLVWLDTPADHTTFDDVRFDGNDIRVAIYVGTRNDLTVTNSRFTGTYFRAAIRGAGERMLISHNRFEESHYWYSPIYMEYGAPTSGEISFNYFAHRVGVNNQVYGDFKSDGTGLWAITNWQPNATTSDGLYIVHNTFHFQDSDLVNQLGNQPIPEAIHIDPLLPASGPIVIRDNIFQGYKYTGPQAGTEPLWQPAGGVFEGALSFDGFDDYGWFVDPDLNIGANGGLSLWVNLNELGRQQTLVHGAMEVQIDASNRIYFYTNKADGSTATLVRTQPLTSILQTGQWVHVGITWDLSTKTGRIYVNGVEAPTGYTHGPVRSGWNNPNPTAGITFFVGDDPTTPGRNLNGKVDDLAFFDATLTAGQMAALANAGGNGALDGPAGNLVLHWTLDQSSGAVAADAVKGLPLTIVPDGTPLGAQDTAEWRDGLGIDFGSGPGGALEFDGLTNYATFSDPDFDIGTNGSLALWVKLDQVGRQQTLIHGALEVQIDASNRIYFYTNKADGANATLVRSQPQTLVAGQWVHIALTWDLAAKTGRIYVNGAEVSYLNGPVRTGWNNPNPTAGQQFIVGNDLTAPQKGTDRRFLNGLMDDVAFFDKTLTLAEIQSIHANGVAPDVNLAAHWSFDTAPSDDVFAGDSGTDIPLNLYRVPPPPHIQGFAINAPAGTVVSNNVFFDNDVDFNPLVNDLGNNIFVDPVLNLGTIPDEDPYQIAFGSVAAWASTEYQADCFTDTPHIGAYQGNPGLFAHGDLVVNGSCGDDLLIIDATDPDNVTISFTWDLGGLHETILTPIPWTNPTGVIFNGKLGDDRFIIVNPPDGVFTLDNQIFFHGGTGGEGSPQGNPEGDRLEIVGGTATTVDHDLTNATDGFVYFNGTLAISYTELEQIVDTIEAEDRQFALPDSENPDVTLQDHADGGQMELSGSTFVDVVFANPSVTLTIDGGVMDDQIAVDSVDPAFRASLIIDGQEGDDTIALGANLLLGSATSAGNLTLTAEAIDVSASSIDTASGANAGSVIFNGPLTVSDNLSINTDHATGTDGNVDFNGTVNSSAGDGHGLIVTAGAGNVTFAEAVGAGTGGALGAVLVNSSGVTRFASTVAAAGLTTDAGGSTELNGNVTTTGAQAYNDAVVLDSPVSVQTTNSAVLFGDTVDSAASEANSLTLTAGAGNATFTEAVGAATDGALGAITINSAADVTFSSTLETTGNVTQVAGSGTTTFNGTSGTGIGGNLSVTTNAIALNSATITTVGTVDLAAQNAISIHSGAGLNAGASTIAIAANQDGTGTQGFTQADGMVIQTTNDSEDAIHIAVGGGGGAAIAALQTGDDGRVTIVAGGPISDTNGDAMNITAGSASLTAAGGIGSSDALETAIDVLAFRNLSTGDVQITNTGDLAIGTLGTVVGGSAGTGSIALKADGDIDIVNDIQTSGGALENGEGLILIDAGGSINLQDGVVVQTGTGQVKGLPTENEANETVPTPPPPIAVVVVPVDQGGSNVNSAGIGYIDVTVNDPGVVNYQIEVDWGDGTVLTYRPEGTFSGGNDFVSEDTYRLSYVYQPDNLPDPENPAAPIPVKVTIRYDGRNVEDSAGGFVRGIVFREGGGELSTTVETELTVPGTGLFGFVKVTESVIVPVELRPITPVVYVLTDVAPTIRQEEMYALQAAAAEQASIGAMRIFFRRVDAAGKEGPDVELPLDAFDRGLDTLFRKFPNGHYRVYLQEANSQRIRLIREIHVYQGRIVPADFRDDVMERQPGSDSGESPNGAAAESQAEPAGAEQPVGPAADDPPADPAAGEQQDTGAAGAAALAAWSARRRIDRLDRALEQAGRTGTKFGRRRRRMSSDQQN
ncbi:MAG: hypothetical protein KJ000_24115 [Pirellulaceae bacterium]|nr:hypothetical protein [Pirellulaceae bacterium]